MPYFVISIFVITSIFALLENKIQKKYVVIVALSLVTVMIFMAGLREVGVDYDSENYEFAYKNYETAEGVDASYIIISSILNVFTDNVHLLFMLYAIAGVLLKFHAIKKMSNSLIIPLMIYLCYYFEMHECMQIRSGILAGFYLISIPYIAEKKRKRALLCLIIGSFFHISGLILLPILLLNNKEFTTRTKTFWCLVIPASYLIYFAGLSVLMSLDIPYIGNKLEIYQRMNDTGHSDLGVNVFSPLLLMNIMMFYYLMYFSRTVSEENKYLPLLIKCYALGISSYMICSFLPVLASRVNILYCVVSILLMPNVAYTIKPRWASVLGLIFFCFIYLNYGLKCFNGFAFLWEV